MPFVNHAQLTILEENPIEFELASDSIYSIQFMVNNQSDTIIDFGWEVIPLDSLNLNFEYTLWDSNISPGWDLLKLWGETLFNRFHPNDTGIFSLQIKTPVIPDSLLNTSFEIKVNLLDNNNCENILTSINVSSGILSSSEIIEPESRIKLFPNPTQRTLNLIYDDKIIIKQYEILNSNGQKYRNAKLQNNQMNVSKLPIGMFYLKIKTSTSEITLPFLKI